MTGELTLRGHVLPVGGVKEKLLAAAAAGMARALVPARNMRDVTVRPLFFVLSWPGANSCLRVGPPRSTLAADPWVGVGLAVPGDVDARGRSTGCWLRRLARGQATPPGPEPTHAPHPPRRLTGLLTAWPVFHAC